MKRKLLIIILILIITPSVYIMYSYLNVRTGTIVFGQEAIVFTQRSWSDIKKLDYNTNGKDWVWIGNNEKISEIYKNYSTIDKNRDYLPVKIRYINLFLPSKASYVQESKMPIVYVIDILPIIE